MAEECHPTTAACKFTRTHFIQIESPTRRILAPILDQVHALEQQYPHRQLLVLLPELIESRWYFYLLHNQRATLLKTMLYLRGAQQTVVANIPWYLEPQNDGSDTNLVRRTFACAASLRRIRPIITAQLPRAHFR